jgi:ADP-heptose:LPS heptosyltransferase
MKILVVQLLRLGDVIMSAPVIHGLKLKYPNAELHVLAFRQFSQLQHLFDDKIHWHWIDREALQKSLGDVNRSFFHAEDKLAKALAPLKRAPFDQVYNLTQTKMSGWICSYIGCPETVGLHFDGRGSARFGSPWFQYLNDHMAAGVSEVFHYVDLFRFATDLNGTAVEWKFKRDEIEIPFDKPYVLAQTLTSEAKKNYPLSAWREAFEIFKISRPGHGIGVMAAQNEVAQLQEAFAGMPDVKVIACTLSQALTLMDHASLLVTLDTSIKHLACASLVPVVELSLGSSDHRRYGIYKAGSLILQGQIVPEAVALAMHLTLGAPGKINEIAAEFAPMSAEGGINKQTNWFETIITPMGFWFAKNLQSETPDADVLQMIEKSSWKFLLTRETQKSLARFGTESVQILRTCEERLHGFSPARLREKLDFLEAEAAKEERRSSPSNWTQALKENQISFDHVRRLQNKKEEAESRTQIRLKLIRSLKSQGL